MMTKKKLDVIITPGIRCSWDRLQYRQFKQHFLSHPQQHPCNFTDHPFFKVIRLFLQIPAFHRRQSSSLAAGLRYSSDSSGLLLTSLRRFLPLSIMIALLQIMRAFQNFVIDIVVSIKIPFMSWLERERSKAQTSNLTWTRLQILNFSFYLLGNVSQRLAGTLSIHSGQHFLVKGTFGILSTTACFLLSGRTEDWKLSLIEPSRSFSPSKQKLRSLSHRAIFNFLGIFLLMEQKSFLTALPSSLSSKGLHAVRSGKVLEIKPVEDEEQRETIRIYGKLFGCHQCGSKQFFENDEDFKVDKIPSTKIAEKINKSWWRKMFRMKVEQRLLPQCQKCARLRANGHTLKYNNKLQSYHFAPAIARIIASAFKDELKIWETTLLSLLAYFYYSQKFL